MVGGGVNDDAILLALILLFPSLCPKFHRTDGESEATVIETVSSDALTTKKRIK